MFHNRVTNYYTAQNTYFIFEIAEKIDEYIEKVGNLIENEKEYLTQISITILT